MDLKHRIGDFGALVLGPGAGFLTRAGVVLTTASGITLALYWCLEALRGGPTHPYLGILFLMILPGIFLAGLLLIPFGILLQRRRRARTGEAPPAPLDFSSPGVRRSLMVIGGFTVLNLLFMGIATAKGKAYMDSNTFCGLACHTVMEPEYRAFVDSPHSRVGCSQCHIGPGADWFVKSKLSGIRQIFAVALGTYSRPIPSPVQHLRPARETCEQCHWPQKFHGDRLVIRPNFQDDEANTPAPNVLLVKVGGRTTQGLQGIHGRHLDDMARITYVASDDRRQEIPVVWYRADDGSTVEFVNTEAKLDPAKLAGLARRKMDCVDCHNRPTHAFDLPEPAVDSALADGRISRDLPFVRREGVALLKQAWPDRQAGREGIAQGLRTFYQTQRPEVFKARAKEIEQASQALQAIYLRNVWPHMKLTWGSHPNHLGHQHSPGCFRCHDGSHVAKDGRTITADCSACHTLLSQGEADPAILKQFAGQ